MQFDVTPGERALLVEILRRDLRDLQNEIHRTDALTYKESLQVRERMLVRIYDRIVKLEDAA